MACRLAMIEQPRAGSAAAAAPQSDVLLATKLHLPASRPGQVSRSRLAERLDEGLAQGLIVVCAPTGYGKTVLLADWARRSEHPAGWLSLDGGDNDPARFWRHVVAALDRARPGIADRVAPLLPPPAPPSFEPLLGALINELAARLGDDEALLVLDDYHVIGSRPVHDSLGFLLEHRPAGLCVVLATRVTRRWRWHGCGPAASWSSCAPISCSAPVSKPNSLAGSPCCTGPRPPGTSNKGWPMTPSGTPWTPERRPGRPG